MDQQLEQRYADWAAGKPFAVSELARLAFEAIGPLRELMEYRQACKGPFALEPAIDLSDWLCFYRRKTLVRSFCEVFFGPKVAPFAYRTYLALKNPATASPVELYCACAIILIAFSTCEPATMETEFPSMPAEEPEDEGLPDEVMNLCFMQFALRVAVPCWFVYGVAPHQLLWNIGGSNQNLAEQAVERLVRLDHHVVHHPILQHWIGADARLAEFRANKIRQWQRRRTPFDKRKKESHWLRVVFGLISAISHLLDHRLIEPDLRELAEILECEIPDDLIAYVRDKTNDDLSRGIRRKRKRFRLPPKPDTSVYTSVRALLRESA